jgi:hypothetical protein
LQTGQGIVEWRQKVCQGEPCRIGVNEMKNEGETGRMENPAIRKCLQHLDIIGASDKTKQIVYMYMKAMDDEIIKLKQSNLENAIRSNK